ncbi:MAG: Serine--tRNA ligase [Nitrosopumilus sp.]|nr:Serine--tRNA ligase [Candidatus Nitrosopumilus limneticus]
MKNISNELSKLESEQVDIEKKYLKLASTIPNLIHDSVPIGVDDSANKEIKKWGNIPKFDFKIKDHIDISQDLDLIDLERAAKVAGARFYYLKNDLVRLNHALIHFGLDFLAEKGYSLVQPPYMINRESMEGAVIAEDFEEVIYKVQEEDLYMIGTSEHAMVAMHSKEIIEGKNMPMKYAGVSPCFRKEAGAHGRDQKGIFRVHQFDKIEQFIFSKPEDSWKEHEKMLEIAEEFYQKLEIPYRVMLLSTGDMGKISAKTYDIEAWMAGQNAYREIVSCSNCLEYQARRLKIRFRDKTNEDTQHVHTLNSTLIATTRVLVAIMENFQTKDGHIRIPQVLQRYMGNQKEIQ